MSLFVDTSVWYAAADADEHDNRAAQEILSRGERLITTDHILLETWFLLRSRLGKPAAETFWEALSSGVAHLETVTGADLAVARGIGDAFPDQDFSIVDRTSFAVMQRLGLWRAASFDNDFAIYRFGPGRKLAFEVVR